MAECAGGEIRVGRHGAPQVQRAPNRKNGFTDAKKKKFLKVFAETGNATTAAEAVGKSVSTVFAHRKNDPAFGQAWAAAQANCYAVLEAELVRRALDLLAAACPEDLSKIAGMDAKLAFTMLQHFHKNMGKQPGDIHPMRSDVAEATKRLEQVMARMGLVGEDDRRENGR